MSLQLLHLLLCEVAFIGWITLEWQWVIRVLGVSLVIDVILSVLPIREVWLIMTHLSSWRVVLRDRLHFLLLWNYLEGFEWSFLDGVFLHEVRVYNASFFFHIEGVFFSQDASLPHLVLIFSLVVWHRAFGVRVLHKPISAAYSSASTSVSQWAAWDYIKKDE